MHVGPIVSKCCLQGTKMGSGYAMPSLTGAAARTKQARLSPLDRVRGAGNSHSELQLALVAYLQAVLQEELALGKLPCGMQHESSLHDGATRLF